MDVVLNEQKDVNAVVTEEARAQRRRQEVIEQAVYDGRLRDVAIGDDVQITQMRMQVIGESGLTGKVLLSIKFAHLINVVLKVPCIYAAHKGGISRLKGSLVAISSKPMALPGRRLPFLAGFTNVAPSFLTELINSKIYRELIMEYLLSGHVCNRMECLPNNFVVTANGKILKRYVHRKFRSLLECMFSLFSAFGSLFNWASLTPVSAAA
ncbi:MAG: hypothetical protein LBS87_00995 [Puniceicoccales bacterium]|jgi:hypothetical protein|nr:hypothetical protein [Puniceicoccales bacterium]